MRRAWCLAIVLGCVAWTGSAVAETPQTLFEDGKRLLHQGDYANACPKLAESMRLDASLGTELHLAECHARTGLTATAWREFRDAEAWAEMKRDPRQKLARERALALAPTLSKVTIVAVPPAEPGLEIRIDGVLLETSKWGTAVPVDPGSHEVTADAPGRKRWATTVPVGPNGAIASVSVPVLEETVALVDVTTVPSSPLRPAPERRIAPTVVRGDVQRVGGVVVIGLGAGSIVVGGVLAGLAKSKLDESNAGHCRSGKLCDGAGIAARSQSLDFAAASTATMIAGGLAVAGGIAIYVLAPRTRPAPHVALSLSVSEATLTLRQDW